MKKSKKIFWSFLFLISESALFLPISSQGVMNYCEVYRRGPQEMVADCDGRGLTKIPSNVDWATTHLNFANNFATQIHKDFLMPVQLVRFATLSNNRLSVIFKDAFNWTKQLQRLNLSYNLIYQFYPGTFNYIPYLQELDLSSNKLRIINATTFQPLINLISLFLANNEISFIERESFQNMTKLQKLNLYGNKLKILSLSMGGIDDSFPPGLKFLWLGKNPLHCDCQTRWLKVGLTQGGFLFGGGVGGNNEKIEYDPNEMLCATTEKGFENIPWNAMKFAEFNCKPIIYYPPKIFSSDKVNIIKPYPISAMESEGIKLECKIYSHPSPRNYNWTKDSEILFIGSEMEHLFSKSFFESGNEKPIDIWTDKLKDPPKYSGGMSSSSNFSIYLTIFNLSKKDEGIYKCAYFNEIGLVEGFFHLSVLTSKPSIDKVINNAYIGPLIIGGIIIAFIIIMLV